MLRLQLIAYKFRISLQFRGSSLFHNSKPKLTLRKSAYQNTLKLVTYLGINTLMKLKEAGSCCNVKSNVKRAFSQAARCYKIACKNGCVLCFPSVNICSEVWALG